MRPDLRLTAVALALLGATACREAPPPPPVPLTVLASSSLARAATEAAGAFEHSANAVVEVRSGSTRELAEEISSGADADLFLATGTDWMDRLEREGRIVAGSRWEAVGNRMVLLGRDEAHYPAVRFVQIASLGFRRFVVPDPTRDPAGRYARRWMRDVGARGDSLWRQLQGRLETVGTVQDVLSAVASDPSAVGVVFASDLGQVPGGVVLARSPDLGIRYSFALVDRTGRPPEARELLELLEGPTGIDVLQRNGFLVESDQQPSTP